MRASELLLFVLLIGGFMLINFVMQRLARRRREQPQEEATAEAAPRPLPVDTEELWGRVPQRVQPAPPAEEEEFWGRAPPGVQPPLVRAAAVREAKVRPPAQPRVSTGRRAATMLGSRQGLRQAMVFMAVLGPCRALAPYEEPAPGSGMRDK